MLDSRWLLRLPVKWSLEVKLWNGDGYEANVMAAWQGHTDQSVCEGIGMSKIGSAASSKEIETDSRKLLEQVLCGVAFSLSLRRGRPRFFYVL
jgi:hypothetical protein